MRAAAQKCGLDIDWHPMPIGRKAYDELGYTLPPGTLEKLDTLDGWVLGPDRSPGVSEGQAELDQPASDPAQALRPLRQYPPGEVAAGAAGALQRRRSHHRAREQRRHAARSQCVHGQRRVPPDARHDDRHSRHHAPGLEQSGARRVRARAHAAAEEAHLGAQGHRVQARVRHVRRRDAARWRRNIPTSITTRCSSTRWR